MSKRPASYSKLESLDVGSEVTINSIIYGELELMIEKSERKKENRILFNEFIKRIRVYPIDKETARIYGKFHSEIFEKFAKKIKQNVGNLISKR